MTLAADMDGDVVGELVLDPVIDMDGENASDVAVCLWMLGDTERNMIGEVDGETVSDVVRGHRC